MKTTSVPMQASASQQENDAEQSSFLVAVIENRAKEVGCAIFDADHVSLRLFQFVGGCSDP